MNYWWNGTFWRGTLMVPILLLVDSSVCSLPEVESLHSLAEECPQEEDSKLQEGTEQESLHCESCEFCTSCVGWPSLLSLIECLCCSLWGLLCWMCEKCVTASVTWACARWRKDTPTCWLSSERLNSPSWKRYHCSSPNCYSLFLN